MQFNNPFKEKGIWLKGNLHTHTTSSDGQFSPQEICRIYGKKGYDFLCIADHHKVTAGFEVPENLLVIPGAEMSKDSFHILGINIKKTFNDREMSPQEIINEITKQKGLAIIAHPYWSSLTSEDLLAVEGYRGIEIFNNICHNLKGKGYSTVHLDETLERGKKISGFASDDTHSEKDLFGSFIMVKALSRNRRSLMSALEKNLFYSSTGVIIKNLSIEGKTLKASFSAAETVDFIGRGHTGGRIEDKRGTLKDAEYMIKGIEKFLRIEITDKNNKKAWTNPIFL